MSIAGKIDGAIVSRQENTVFATNGIDGFAQILRFGPAISALKRNIKISVAQAFFALDRHEQYIAIYIDVVAYKFAIVVVVFYFDRFGF